LAIEASAEENIMRTFSMLATAALTLAGCSGGDDNDGKSPASPDPTQSVSAFKVKPGLWEIKITFKTIEAKGLALAAKQQMLAAMGDGITMKNCVTKEQSEKPGAAFFGSPNSSNCTIGSFTVTGGQMSVKLICKPESKSVIESSMVGTFGADSYSMNVKQKASGTPMGDFITTGKIDGKRLGDCPT
jgi:hypothetical protein